MWWRERGYFQPSRPRPVIGGIKARAQRGDFGASWWGKRWVQVLESFDIGARLNRGKSYARRGQVMQVQIKAGEVVAQVQGSMPEPYDVCIAVKRIAAKDWDRVVAALSRQAVFSAKLLAGEMPADIESAFSGVGLSLFPERLQDLTTECSCPDWSNPCKHIAATYYLLAEEFDRNPFLLFRMRGLERDDLMRKLAAVAPVEPASVEVEGATPLPYAPPLKLDHARPKSIEQIATPLAADPGAFWSFEPLDVGYFGVVEAPPVHGTILTQLGGFPFWRGARPIDEALVGVYAAASPRGLSAFLGESTGVALVAAR